MNDISDLKLRFDSIDKKRAYEQGYDDGQNHLAESIINNTKNKEIIYYEHIDGKYTFTAKKLEASNE